MGTPDVASAGSDQQIVTRCISIRVYRRLSVVLLEASRFWIAAKTLEAVSVDIGLRCGKSKRVSGS